MVQKRQGKHRHEKFSHEKYPNCSSIEEQELLEKNSHSNCMGGTQKWLGGKKELLPLVQNKLKLRTAKAPTKLTDFSLLISQSKQIKEKEAFLGERDLVKHENLAYLSEIVFP